MKAKTKRWSYKGLECTIEKRSRGYIANVYDTGYITNEKFLVLYKGGPNQITKEEIEQEIDEFLLSLGKPTEFCSYYGTAVAMDYCPFSCNMENCIFGDVIV